jgi:FkbM family methyltransferase
MDVKALLNNIIDSIKTTGDLPNAVKKVYWLYNGSGKIRRAGAHTARIKFNYPAPVGPIDLKVRYNNGADVFIISEVFRQQCYKISLTNEVTCILDLGANAGFTAVYFSRLYPRAKIACVEPMPNNIAVLKENLALNNVNSHVFEAAATIKDEKIIMDNSDKDYGNKVHDIPFGKTMSYGTLEVDGLSIKTILKQLNWNKIDLLKIDIEGYEGILLHQNNEWLEKVDTIIMEIHEGLSIDDIKGAVAPFNFTQVKNSMGNWILSKNQIL